MLAFGFMKALTVRRKIQIGLLLLIVGILGASFLATGAALRHESDPAQPLREFAGQFDHFRRTEGEALYAAITVASDDAEIEAALSKGDLVNDEIRGEWGLGQETSGVTWTAVKQRNAKPDPDSVVPDETQKLESGGWDDEKKKKSDGDKKSDDWN